MEGFCADQSEEKTVLKSTETLFKLAIALKGVYDNTVAFLESAPTQRRARAAIMSRLNAHSEVVIAEMDNPYPISFTLHVAEDEMEKKDQIEGAFKQILHRVLFLLNNLKQYLKKVPDGPIDGSEAMEMRLIFGEYVEKIPYWIDRFKELKQ